MVLDFRSMAFHIPPRTTEVEEVSFHAISGVWHDELMEIMKNLGVTQNPQIRVSNHYDSNILVKVGVELRLPTSLGLRVSRFESEARHRYIAFHMVMVNAILGIRHEKDIALLGTSFTALPVEDSLEDMEISHISFIRTAPVEAAKYLDNCVELLSAFTGIFKSMDGEIGNLLNLCTDHGTLRQLHEMRQTQVPTPQPSTPVTPVYPYVAETPPYPYYNSSITTPCSET